jgi:hypothetical protein
VSHGPDDLDEQLRRLEVRLPRTLSRFVAWLRQPSATLVRVPMAGLFILGGFVGFLPLLGFWMIPLGLVLLAINVPFLRRPTARLLAWIEAKWPARPSAKPD